MNKKIITIAGIIFALAFVSIFLVIWCNTNDVIKTQANAINELYAADAPFDVSLFDNQIVTGRTLKNFESDMEKNQFTRSFKIYDISDNIGTSSIEDNKIYRTYLHENDNGVIDGITYED